VLCREAGGWEDLVKYLSKFEQTLVLAKSGQLYRYDDGQGLAWLRTLGTTVINTIKS
jgi:hypothetical protein